MTMFLLPGFVALMLLWNLAYAHWRGRLLRRAAPILGITVGCYVLPSLVMEGCGTLMFSATLYIGSLLAGLGLSFYLMWQANEGESQAADR